ncbi:Serine protease inhibitor swm-1 like protein [Argiope bruennichi]|uniref:Serine protease inhibitor swm-1 like protein n=1 Tax=Argiope bruennichi TaxID=94029 RepID=A0A8T0ERA5_ARGBR|nr:Serine protease inhibitor swm-1 like protein [Argiope bruennichi]
MGGFTSKVFNMIFSPFFIITIILAFLPAHSSSCPENEIETDCVNPCNTCEQKGRCDHHLPCRHGCDCKIGFYRDENGFCVQEQQCLDPAPKCPKNAIFIKCGSPCPPTCDDLQPEPCEEKCTTACYCKPGYLKRKDDVCVRPIDCHPRKKQDRPRPECASDEQFYECKPSCKNTCSHFQNPGVQCRCGPPGCFCKAGLVKRSDGKCVPLSQCPDMTILDDYHGCPSTAECEAYCKSLGDFVGLCTGKCRPAAFDPFYITDILKPFTSFFNYS